MFLRCEEHTSIGERSRPSTPEMSRDQDGASFGVAPDAEHGPPRSCGSNLHVATAAGQEEGEETVRNPRTCLRAEQRPVLVPCLRSCEANLETPIVNEANRQRREQQAPLAEESTNAVFSYASSHGVLANVGEAAQPGDDVEKDGPCAGVGVETTRHQLGSGAQARGIGAVVASVRAGDWVLPNRGDGSKCLGGRQGSGWLRVEAVSVG